LEDVLVQVGKGILIQAQMFMYHSEELFCLPEGIFLIAIVVSSFSGFALILPGDAPKGQSHRVSELGNLGVGLLGNI